MGALFVTMAGTVVTIFLSLIIQLILKQRVRTSLRSTL